MQSELGSLFAKAIEEPFNNIFVIETHSEKFTARIAKLVRTKKLSNDNISIIYVDKTKEGSICCPIRLDEEGKFIDKWPKAFFTEDFDELFDL